MSRRDDDYGWRRDKGRSEHPVWPGHDPMPDPSKILATVRRAADLFRTTPGRSGSIIRLETADEVMVVGDLHGNLAAFRRALTVADLAGRQGRHLVLQELVHDLHVDPDEGLDQSHRLVDLACALKCQ